MDNHSNRKDIGRSERGGTGITILCTILGTGVILVGVLFLIMGISFMLDGEDFGLVLFAELIAIIAIAAGILLIILPHRVNKNNAKPMSGPDAKTADGPRVVSREVIAGPDTETVARRPDRTDDEEDLPQEKPEPEAYSATEEVANMVARSHDVFAALKDLVRHETTGGITPRHHLASMLTAAGLMDWDNAPACEAGRLTRNHHFWIRLNTDDLSEEDYDRLVSIEAALSVNQDLGNYRSTATVDDSNPEVARRILGDLSKQEIKPYSYQNALDAAYPGTDAADTPCEWVVRSSVASAAECAVTPFRVVYDERCYVEKGTLALSLEIPRPQCMAIFTSDWQEQLSLARSYALRLATMLARTVMQHTTLGDKQLIQTIYVNCHEHGTDDTIMALRLDQRLVARLQKLLEDSKALEDNGFPMDENIRATFGDDGWFDPVEPFATLNDEEVSPAWRFIYPELVDKPTSDQLRAITGARTVSDLGINENAGRLAAWDELTATEWDSTEDVVSRLKQMLFDAQDITVVEACNRTIEALVQGSVDASDQDEIGRIFLRGTALERAVSVAEAALDESDGPDDPEKAVTTLSDALAPIESLGAYLDDSDTVYRYFGSIAERIRFNLDVDDHRRTVRLVPDAYYNALSNISIAYDEMGELDKALQYAEEMIRIAPTSIHATLRKVRVLEHQTHIYEAADLIKSILRLASTPRDAAICHYRLAFMEWKLGRADLAVACYQRALMWDTEMASQANEELNDLLNSDDSLKKLSDDEVFSLLAKEGIPLGCDESDKRRLLASATLCTDEGVFWAARPLVGIIFGQSNDDVMMGVYRSLAWRA